MMIERLAEFLETNNISKSELADSTGIGRPAITHIFNGRYKITDATLSKILQTYPQLNSNWLINGIGDMLIDQSPILEEETTLKLNFPEETLNQSQTNEPIKTEKDLKVNESLPSENEWLDSNANREKSLRELDIENQNVPRADFPQIKPVRKVNKIVFFYDDKSFEEYYPQ